MQPARADVLDAGVDLATGDYDSRTALHLAVCNGQAETVKFLVSHVSVNGLNVIDRMRHSAYDDAVAFKQDACLAALKEAGALPGATPVESDV